MNTFYANNLYENFKDIKDCLYVDLDSESSDEMLYKCAGSISKKINNQLEKKEGFTDLLNKTNEYIQKRDGVFEGFTSNCCPDGTTNINNTCQEICKNCKYNDCNYGSSNLGNSFVSSTFGTKDSLKGKQNMYDNEELFNYVINDFTTN